MKSKGTLNANLYRDQCNYCWHMEHTFVSASVYEWSGSVWLAVAEGCFYNQNTDVRFWMCDSTAASVIAISGTGCAINCIVRACVHAHAWIHPYLFFCMLVSLTSHYHTVWQSVQKLSLHNGVTVCQVSFLSAPVSRWLQLFSADTCP